LANALGDEDDLSTCLLALPYSNVEELLELVWDGVELLDAGELLGGDSCKGLVFGAFLRFLFRVEVGFL
jgi:hypothetical protein